MSKIEWTDVTWNPVRGCSRVSEGCRHCYAERMASRFCGKGEPFYGYAVRGADGQGWTGRVELIEHKLREPLGWRNPRWVFVNSMSDLFHERLPESDIRRVFQVMNEATQHGYQILTKRAKRLAELGPKLPWHENIVMGVSVEDSRVMDRIRHLRDCGATRLFLSLEPLIGPLDGLDLTGIDWVIAGGESGPGARPMRVEWLRPIRDECRRLGIPFFFKQWGKIQFNPNPLDDTKLERGGAKGGCKLDDRTHLEMPLISPTLGMGLRPLEIGRG